MPSLYGIITFQGVFTQCREIAKDQDIRTVFCLSNDLSFSFITKSFGKSGVVTFFLSIPFVVLSAPSLAPLFNAVSPIRVPFKPKLQKSVERPGMIKVCYG